MHRGFLFLCSYRLVIVLDIYLIYLIIINLNECSISESVSFKTNILFKAKLKKIGVYRYSFHLMFLFFLIWKFELPWKMTFQYFWPSIFNCSNITVYSYGICHFECVHYQILSDVIVTILWSKNTWLFSFVVETLSILHLVCFPFVFCVSIR